MIWINIFTLMVTLNADGIIHLEPWIVFLPIFIEIILLLIDFVDAVLIYTDHISEWWNEHWILRGIFVFSIDKQEKSQNYSFVTLNMAQTAGDFGIF
jgi:hypothetical protein